jgi:hypothetical protein
MVTAQCSMSTARLLNERFRMIEADEVGTDVVGADLDVTGDAEAGHQVLPAAPVRACARPGRRRPRRYPSDTTDAEWVLRGSRSAPRSRA